MNFPPTAMILVAAALMLLAGCSQSIRTDDTTRYRLVGYVAGWNPIVIRQPGKLDVINYAFAHIDVHGEVVLDNDAATRQLAQLCALKQQNPALRVLLSIGGWGAEGFSDAAASAAARERFADSVDRMILAQSLDGIDLDWEYPGRSDAGIHARDTDRQNFPLLLHALRTHLRALDRNPPGATAHLLTIAAADSEFIDHLELGQIASEVDWINLMSYDFFNRLSTRTGHHAALRTSAKTTGARSAERGVQQYLAAGVPAEKIVLGLAFYGRGFGDVGSKDDGLNQPFGHYLEEYSWTRLQQDFIGNPAYTRHWDTQAKAPWLWDPVARIFISYEDEDSIRAKVAWLRRLGLGGAMYWEHGQDPSEQLLDAAYAALRAPAAQ